MRPRRIIRIEDYWDSNRFFALPEADYEWQSSPTRRTAFAVAIGRDYAVDLLGNARAPLDRVTETVRFSVSQPDPGALQAWWVQTQRVLDRIGRARVVAENPDGSREWAIGRVSSYLAYSVSAYSWLRMPVSLTIERITPWYAETTSTESWTIGAGSHTFSVGGTTATSDLVIELQAGSAGGYDAPQIVDYASGSTITIPRTAATAGERLRINCLDQVAEWSPDGVNWTALGVSIPSTQYAWFALVPDTADIRVFNAPDATATMTWRDASG